MGRLEDEAERERHYQELRLRVQQRHRAATEATAADAPDRDAGPAIAELMAATDELIAFTDRLPVLADLPARALSVQVVRAAALAALLGGVLFGLGVWRAILGVAWVVAAVVTVAAAGVLATLSVAPAAGGHRRQRYLAVVCGAAGLLAAPVAAVYSWPAGLGCVLVQMLAFGVLADQRWHLRDTRRGAR